MYIINYISELAIKWACISFWHYRGGNVDFLAGGWENILTGMGSYTSIIPKMFDWKMEVWRRMLHWNEIETTGKKGWVVEKL